MNDTSEITALLDRWKNGDPAALERLLPIVYDELKVIAYRQFQKEKSGHTLQPTAIVHETYLKILGQDPGRVDNRIHFYALAAKAMRQVLVDHSRRRAAEKRAGDLQRMTLTDALGRPLSVTGTSEDTLAVHQALERLAEIRPRAARVVELRYFGGMSLDQTAEVLSVTQKTVVRDWQTARLWLLDRLTPNR